MITNAIFVLAQLQLERTQSIVVDMEDARQPVQKTHVLMLDVNVMLVGKEINAKVFDFFPIASGYFSKMVLNKRYSF